MSTWWVWITVAMFAGLGAGFFFGRSSSAGARRALELDQELRETRGELDRYRSGVVEHFTTTAELVNKLTADYRAVYQHLSRGAQELAGGRIPQLEALAAPQAERVSPPPPALDEFLEELDDHGVRREEAALSSGDQDDPSSGAQSGRARSEGWYDDAAPGTEIPEYAREERQRQSAAGER